MDRPAVLTKGSPPLDSSNTTSAQTVTNGQIHNNNNINKTNKKFNGTTKVALNSGKSANFACLLLILLRYILGDLLVISRFLGIFRFLGILRYF